MVASLGPPGASWGPAGELNPVLYSTVLCCATLHLATNMPQTCLKPAILNATMPNYMLSSPCSMQATEATHGERCPRMHKHLNKINI